jgi:hypothetical protein
MQLKNKTSYTYTIGNIIHISDYNKKEFHTQNRELNSEKQNNLHHSTCHLWKTASASTKCQNNLKSNNYIYGKNTAVIKWNLEFNNIWKNLAI